MRCTSLLALALAFALLPADVHAQKGQGQGQEREEEFLKGKPAVGDPLAELTVYSPNGTEFKTADLRGHYTVLTFGCLT